MRFGGILVGWIFTFLLITLFCGKFTGGFIFPFVEDIMTSSGTTVDNFYGFMLFASIIFWVCIGALTWSDD